MNEATRLITTYRDALLGVEKLAQLLGVSKTSVYRLVERRAIPFHRIPAGLRFSPKDVDEYLSRCRKETIGAAAYGSTKN